MKRFLALLGAASLLMGCASSTMFLRYTYEPVFTQLPPCSRVISINNDFVTYSSTEGEFNTVTNYYRAYYSTEGKVYKTVHIIK